MLLQGLLLLVVGMGIVWMFLLLLVCVLNVSARVIPRFNHWLPNDASKTGKGKSARSAASDDEVVAVAIAAAVSALQRES